MKILAIETSCDETAFALVEARGGLRLIKSRLRPAKGGFKNPKFKVLENLVSSQIEIHKPFGGVVPNLAKREHIRNLPVLFEKIMAGNSSNSKLRIKNSELNIKTKNFLKTIDLLCVTVGPGLEPALWTGINFAKELYRDTKLQIHPNAPKKLKLIGVSHLEGHLYSFLLNQKTNSELRIKNSELFPAIALIVSGGHTILLLMSDLTHYKILGQTRDDAVGEAFDKAARLLGLPYPGGPEIERLAKKGRADMIDFPRPMLSQKNYDFSFSGLKTSLLYYLRDNKKSKKEDVAASFQKAAFDVVVGKTLRAVEEFGAKSIMVSGGVSASKALANEFKKSIKKKKINAKLLITKFPTDNAAMIAAAGYISYLRKKNRRLTANGNLGL